MAVQPSVADRLIDASLALVTAKGWVAMTMADVAREAGVSLAETFKHVRSKGELLSALVTRIDQRMLDGVETSADEPARDRLFDVIMRRFDALQSHKPAVTAIVRQLPRDPLSALPLIPRFAQSMLWILEAAGISTAGPLGLLRAKGLAIVYLSTLRVWMTDDSQDLSQTMAALDKALTQADTLVRRLPMLGGAETASPPSDPSNSLASDPNDPGEAAVARPA